MPAQPYILPSLTEGLPGGLTLIQFIQTIFVGLTGLPGSLVRPKWQVEPPKQPDILTNWMALGVDVAAPDANSYVDTNEAGAVVSQRHETLEISCDIYGPDALETAGLIRDGFQIQTNLEALTLANMGFVEVSPMRHLPDLVNERYINRVIMGVFIRREIQRVYPVPTVVSANGTIYTGGYSVDWDVQP